MIDLNSLPIDKWSIDDLLGMYRERVDALAPLLVERDTIVTEIQSRCGDRIKYAFTTADKTHGKVTVKIDELGTAEAAGEIDVEVRQTVTWDQDMLKGVFEKHPDDAQHVVKADLYVEEKTYKALIPGALKDAITAARTTKLSKPSLKIRLEN